MSRSKKIVHAALTAAMALTGALHAAPFTWDGGSATTNNWTDAINWSTNVAPTNDGLADITFAGAVRLTPQVDTAQSINSLTFAAGASPFTIGGSVLTIGGGGITNNDDANQSTNVSIVLGAPQTWTSGAITASGGLQFNLPAGSINTNGHLLTLSPLTTSTINILTPIVGTGAVTLNGPGTVNYSSGGNNTYNGTTIVNAGTLALNKSTADAAFAGPLIIGDGAGTDTVRLNADNQIDVAVTINSSGVLDFVARTDSIPVPTLAGGTITGTAASNMLLSGVGPLTSLASSSTAAISVGSLGLNFPAGREFAVEDGSAAIDLEISSPISNTASGGITKTGAGTLRLSGATANTYTGANFIIEGELVLAKSSAIAIAGSLTIGNTSTNPPPATVRLAGSNQINSSSAVTINDTGLLEVGSNLQVFNNLTLTGGELSMFGGGTARLTGAITATSSSNTALIHFGTVDHLGAVRTWTINDGPQLLDAIVGSVISNGGIIKAGLGTLAITGNTDNTFALGTTVQAGTLMLSKSPGRTSVANLVIGDDAGGAGADQVFLTSDEQIADSAVVSVTTSGLLDMAGNDETFNTLHMTGGLVNVGAGTFKFTQLTTVGNTTATISGSGDIDFDGGNTIFLVNDGTSAIDADISPRTGNGGLVKNGAGTLQLSGDSQYAHARTNVNEGVLLLNRTGQELFGTITVGDGLGGAATDIVRYGQSNQIAGTQANTVTINQSGLLDLNGFIDLIGPLTMTSGSVTTGAGTLSLNTSVTTLASSSSASITGAISLTGASVTFNVGQGSAPIDLDIPANIAQGSITKTGLGTLRLSGTNTNNFATTFLTDGTLLLGGNSVVGQALSLSGGTVEADGAPRTITNVILSGDGAAGGTFDLTFTNVSASGKLTKNGTATLTFPNPTTIFDTLTLNSGTLSASSLTTVKDFIHNGGTLAGTLTSQGSYTNISGNLAGKLINQGTINFASSLTAGGGIENHTQITVAGGQTLSTGGSGLLNLGTIHLTGGTIAGATFTNDFGAQLEARGTINSFLINNGQLQTSGLLTIATGGENVGVIFIFSTQSLRLGDDFGNRGLIQLSSGGVAGNGAIVNAAGGQVQGSGGVAFLENSGGLVYANASAPLVISTFFGNTAGGELRIADESALNVINAFGSSGTIVLEGTNASLAGGQLSNSGTISGRGRISNRIVNSGVIRAEGGLLTLSGASAINGVAGNIQAPAGATVFYSQGLVNNEGTIALSAGTFDNNARLITNTGTIDGRGIFRSGGLTNANKIAIADGPTEFFGDVINDGSITITNTTGTFFNNVTNNATGTIKTTSAVSRFLGTFTNSGTFLSDPSDNHFENLTLSETGILIGGLGDRFFVSGDLISASTAADRWDTRLAELILQGAGVHDVSVNGDDLGITFDGYENNFAWGKLLLGAGNRLALQDGDDEPGGAIYVRELILAGGLSQISNIESNGLSIYYDLGDPSNAYLGGATYALSGGGQIAPVPEPLSASLSLIALTGLLRRTRRARR